MDTRAFAGIIERMAIRKRRLGKTNAEVSILGLGGEGVLREPGHDKAAAELINTALDLGINYMETARAYGPSESYYGSALAGRRKDIFLAGKAHAREKSSALESLAETLKNLKTDYLDLWQVHDVRTEDDMNKIFGPGGALEAFREAKEKGSVRFIGVTGHHSPSIIRRCLEAFDFDTVLIPVNPAETCAKSFLEEVMPVAGPKDVGVIAMKVFLRGLFNAPKKLLLSYALSQPVSAAVVGCDNIEQLKENAEAAESFQSLKVKEMERLHRIVSPYAGELMFYRQK